MEKTSSGGKVAYVEVDSIWAMDLETGHRQKVAEGRVDSPRWSPDGRMLLFRRYSGEARTPYHSVPLYHLFVFREETGVSEEIASQPVAEAKWSPDGRWIAYRTYSWPETPGPYDSYVAGDLWLADPTGSVRKELLPPGPSGARSFSWAPDSRTISFGTANSVETINIDDGTRKRLLSFPTLKTYSEFVWAPDPHWSPDGRRILALIWDETPGLGHGGTVHSLDPGGQDAPASKRLPGAQIEESQRVFHGWSQDGQRALLSYVGPDARDSRIYSLKGKLFWWDMDAGQEVLIASFSNEGLSQYLVATPPSANERLAYAKNTSIPWRTPTTEVFVVTEKADHPEALVSLSSWHTTSLLWDAAGQGLVMVFQQMGESVVEKMYYLRLADRQMSLLAEWSRQGLAPYASWLDVR